MTAKRCFGSPPPGLDLSRLTGALIVIEGPDSSGRSTHIGLLAEWLQQNGYPVAQIGLTGSRTSFINAAGQEVSSFAVGSTAWIRVEDHNWNDPGQTDSVQVRVRSLTSADQEDLMLQETGVDSAVFTGSLPLTSSSSVGVTSSDAVMNPPFISSSIDCPPVPVWWKTSTS